MHCMQAENQLAALERDMKEKMESAEKEVSSCLLQTLLHNRVCGIGCDLG